MAKGAAIGEYFGETVVRIRVFCQSKKVYDERPVRAMPEECMPGKKDVWLAVYHGSQGTGDAASDFPRIIPQPCVAPGSG